jgi:hypothetical protein
MEFMDENKIYELIITPALQRADEEMPNFELSQMKRETPLYGVQGAMLDSLNLISFVFIVEEEFERVSGKKLKVTTQDVLNPSNPPFANINALILFLKGKL